MKNDNYKALSFIWDVPYYPYNSETNRKWQLSESFTWPDCDKISFSVHLMDWFDDEDSCGSIIKIEKKGILDPRRAVVTIRSREICCTEVMENWTEDFSSDFKADSAYTPRSAKIYCYIKLDSLDFYDKSSLLTSLRTPTFNYLLSAKFSDVIIKVENEEEELPAHKIILSSFSPVFDRMVNANMVEARQNCITLREIDIYLVKQVLMFIYTGKIEQDDDTDMLVKLLACADVYQIDNLKTFCEYQLIQNFTADNIVKILVETDRFEMPLLKKTGRIYMDFNKTRISYRKAIVGALRSTVLYDFFSGHMKMIIEEH